MAAAFFLLTGCSAALKNPLFEADGSVALPWASGGERLQVVFPAGAAGPERGNDSLTRWYGPDWTDLQDVYEEFSFNGER